MKIFLLEELNPKDIFKMSTDTSYYDEFFEQNSHSSGNEYMQREKNKTGKVVMMSPNEYYEHCANDIFDGTSVEQIKRSRGANSDIQTYKDAMLRGDKFPIPYLDFVSKNQEGLHRMMCVGEIFGWDTKVPVLCVYVYDQEREDKKKLQEEIDNFERYYLPKCTEKAETYVNDKYWDATEVPQDFTIIWHDLVIKYAQQEYNVNIDVEVEIKEIDDGHKVYTYLTSYNGTEISYIERCDDNIWLEDLFYSALHNNNNVTDDIDSLLSDDGLLDDDISDYFFK